MQPNHSRCYLRQAIGHAGLGVLLAFAGCMAAPADDAQVEPGQTSSELGTGPGPGVTPTAHAAAGASAPSTLSTILPPTAGAPALPTRAPCATDADCRVERNNCSACACQALGASQSMNACYGEKVTCVLDPCADTVARCVAGHCTAEAEGVR